MTSQVLAPPPVVQPGQEEVDTFFQRGLTKCKQQPLVPLGAVVTTWALLSAVREFKRGNSQNVNRYLRFRVVAQGATVAAMLVGSYVYEQARTEQKEQEKAAERDRMFRILDGLGDGTTPVAPPAPATEPAPSPIPQPQASASESPTPEKRPGQTRYIGSDDKLMEFFNRKRAEKSEKSDSPPSNELPPTTPGTPSNPSKGWFPWS